VSVVTSASSVQRWGVLSLGIVLGACHAPGTSPDGGQPQDPGSSDGGKTYAKSTIAQMRQGQPTGDYELDSVVDLGETAKGNAMYVHVR
jgi:hypothetical protein